MRRLCIVLISASLTGCVREADEDSPSNVRWELSPDPIAAIGGADERDGYLLQRVLGATRLGDGRIVVADGGSSEIRFYDSKGAHLKTVGGDGDGPAEYRGLMSLTRGVGDTLLVHAFRPGVAVLSPDGEFVQGFSWNSGSMNLECRYWDELSVASGPSMVGTFALNRGAPSCPGNPGGIHRDSILLARYDLATERLDTVRFLPGVERNGEHYRAYGVLPVATVSWDRVVAGGTESDSLVVLDVGGEEVNRIAVPWEPRSIGKGAKAETVRRLEYEDGSVSVGEPWNYPTRYPRMGRVVYDGFGWVWFMRYPEYVDPDASPGIRYPSIGRFGVEEGSTWRAAEIGRGTVAEIDLPAGLHLLEVGADYVLGLHRDEVDLETVMLFELRRHAS